MCRKWREWIIGRDLEDPLVNDDNGDIESPPLKDGQERSDDAPLANEPLFHLLVLLLPIWTQTEERRSYECEYEWKKRGGNGEWGTSSTLMRFASSLSLSLSHTHTHTPVFNLAKYSKRFYLPPSLSLFRLTPWKWKLYVSSAFWFVL